VRDRLTAHERDELRSLHRRVKQPFQADRIKAVLLLDGGWTCERVAEALLIDDETVRRWEKRYLGHGVEGLLVRDCQGSDSKLDDGAQAELKQHLEQTLYQTTKEIIHYVLSTYGVAYSLSGMHALLHRMEFVYKKCRHIPSKADEAKQRAFVEEYQQLKEQKKPQDRILFVDGCHPQHNSLLAYGWIPKGKEHLIPANTGRQRLNINGALDIDTLEVVTRNDETLNAESTIAFFQEIERSFPLASVIYLILDNARYYRARAVTEFLHDSRIRLMFLPSYSPNLNIIERLWRFFKKNVLYNSKRRIAGVLPRISQPA
jgi:transposase